jgi:phosphomethylpyrimidine synthase
VREYAAAKKLRDIEVAVEEGMKEKSEEFLKQGAEIYKEI